MSVSDSKFVIYYCPKCNSTYGNPSDVVKPCPDCHILLKETTIDRDQWRGYSDAEKTRMKQQFSKGLYIKTNNTPNSNDFMNSSLDVDTASNRAVISELKSINNTLLEIKKHTGFFYIVAIIGLVLSLLSLILNLPLLGR